jgi:L-fuculose-phosphate aldolase
VEEAPARRRGYRHRRVSIDSDLIATARRMSDTGMVAGSVGNVSVRLDDGDMLVTPTRLAYAELTDDDLVRIDRRGRIVGGHRTPSREWPTHLAVYACRPDVRAVVHTHSPHATAWSFLGQELALPTEELEALGGPIATAEHGATGSVALATGVAAAIGDRQAVLMARHGAVGVGPDLGAALAACELVEHQAHVELLLRSAGR